MKKFYLRSAVANGLKSLAPVALLVLLASCTNKRPDIGLRATYNDAQVNHYQGNVTLTEEKFQQIIAEQRGTRYAGYAYLLMGDAKFSEQTSESLQSAKIYYRLFLDTNRNSHLVPYVLSQLIVLDFLLNESKLFVKHTDTSPYKEAINNYRKFYFMYPNSQYLVYVKDILGRSVEKLALIEETIGDWYFEQQLYVASVNRFHLILKDYPDYSESRRITDKLLIALRKNNQDKLAEEYLKGWQRR